MSADERERLIEAVIARQDGDVRLLLLLSGVTLDQFKDKLPGIQRALASSAVSTVLAALADDPAQAALAEANYELAFYRANEACSVREEAITRVEALADEWHGRATEATSEPLSWRRVSTDLRAALVPGHDHEGGK